MLGNFGLITSQNVCVSLDFFSALSDCNSFEVCESLFSYGCSHLLFHSQGQLPVSDDSFEVFNFSWEQALHFVVWKVYILRMFSAGLLLSSSTSKLQSLVFFTVLRGSLKAITFSIKKKKGEFSLADLFQRFNDNQRKSATSFYESDSKRLLFVFSLKKPLVLFIFHWFCAPPPTMEFKLMVSLFNGISILFRLFNAKAILLLEEQQRYYLTHSWEDKGVHTFPKGICLKVNIIVRLEYELTYYDSAVHRFNHYTTRTSPNNDDTSLN